MAKAQVGERPVVQFQLRRIRELGRAIFGITISHCTVDPESSVPSLARGAAVSGTLRVAGKSEVGRSLSAMGGTLDLADSSATNNVDHSTRNRNPTARSAPAASPVGSPIRCGGSTILACESNMYDLPDHAVKMPG